MHYHYLRMILTAFERPPLLERAGSVPRRTTRQEYLSSVFENRIDFEHRQKRFVYVPLGRADRSGGTVALGRIGRPVEVAENQPPETGFEETLRPTWRAANVVVDITDHADGQKIAFQYRQDVGKPLSIAASLVIAINAANQDSGWKIDINAIFEKASFWKVVEENKGRITSAIFSYNAPNVLRMRSKLNEDLERGKREHNIDRYTETLENDTGDLVLEGSDVEDAVDFTSEGGGSAKLKSGKKVIYNSEKAEKSITVEDDEALSKENQSTWKRIVDILF